VDYEHWRKESQIWTWAANCVSHMNSKIDKDVMTFRGQVGDKAEPPTLNTVSLKWAVRMHGRIPREGMRSIGLIKSGGWCSPCVLGPHGLSSMSKAWCVWVRPQGSLNLVVRFGGVEAILHIYMWTHCLHWGMLLHIDAKFENHMGR
jgi:hypothetical protein